MIKRRRMDTIKSDDNGFFHMPDKVILYQGYVSSFKYCNSTLFEIVHENNAYYPDNFDYWYSWEDIKEYLSEEFVD